MTVVLTPTRVVGTHRRYCILKAHAHKRAGNEELYLTFLGKALGFGSAPDPLPVDVPFAEALIAAGYLTLSSFDDATATELSLNASTDTVALTVIQAEAALRAIAALAE